MRFLKYCLFLEVYLCRNLQYYVVKDYSIEVGTFVLVELFPVHLVYMTTFCIHY